MEPKFKINFKFNHFCTSLFQHNLDISYLIYFQSDNVDELNNNLMAEIKGTASFSEMIKITSHKNSLNTSRNNKACIAYYVISNFILFHN